ncbi:methyltransferase domain-containing protein [Marinoscillum pacificum]|uniref:methyltransferase domain-containing protein n=1 Tax=Marinoscillum pacificum TaxID=392723 RepID=UPI0021580787|nr:methyltransferase domain-containing protein [Marinoscillum pacificum]
MNLLSRSNELEIMDDLDISGEVVPQTLKELDTINQLLGGNQISLSSYKQICQRFSINSLADLGCGSADILIRMNKINPKAQYFGFDANPNIVTYANEHIADFNNLKAHCENIFSKEFKSKSFDVIHCCLFLHHFTHQELVDLFKQFKTQAKKAIIVNDLHRHFLAYHSIKWITRFFSKSYMVRNDAAVSVARGFKKAELLTILKEAEIENYSLSWKWAFRWQLVITCD